MGLGGRKRGRVCERGRVYGGGRIREAWRKVCVGGRVKEGREGGPGLGEGTRELGAEA